MLVRFAYQPCADVPSGQNDRHLHSTFIPVTEGNRVLVSTWESSSCLKDLQVKKNHRLNSCMSCMSIPDQFRTHIIVLLSWEVAEVTYKDCS